MGLFPFSTSSLNISMSFFRFASSHTAFSVILQDWREQVAAGLPETSPAAPRTTVEGGGLAGSRATWRGGEADEERRGREEIEAGRRRREAAPSAWQAAVEGRRRRWRRLGTLAAAGVDGDRAEELVSKRRPLVGCP